MYREPQQAAQHIAQAPPPDGIPVPWRLLSQQAAASYRGLLQSNSPPPSRRSSRTEPGINDVTRRLRTLRELMTAHHSILPLPCPAAAQHNAPPPPPQQHAQHDLVTVVEDWHPPGLSPKAPPSTLQPHIGQPA